jgi:uncharacterized membrane protein YbhN (UPF0104 family)
MNLKRLISLGLLAALLIGILYWWRNQSGGGFSWDKFLEAGAQVDLRWLAMAAVLILVAYGLRGMRWGVMMKPVCPRPERIKLIGAQFTGFAAVAILGRPGELVRPVLIASQQGVSVQSQMSIWFLERIFDLLLVMGLFGFSLSQLGAETIGRVGPTLGWLLKSGGGVAGLSAGACVVSIGALRYLSGPLEAFIEKLAGWLPGVIGNKLLWLYQSFAEGIGAMQSTRQILTVLGYSAAHWAVIVGMFYCLCHGFGPTSHLSALDGMVIYGFIAFGSIVQLPGVGGGMQIVTALVLTELYGVGLEAAGLMGILVWMIGFVLAVPLGLVFALVYGLRLSELRGMAVDSSARSQDSSTAKYQS